MIDKLNYGRPGLAIATGPDPVPNVAGEVAERTPPAPTVNPDIVLLLPFATYTYCPSDDKVIPLGFESVANVAVAVGVSTPPPPIA
jgi:hypothetical protein